METNIIDDLIKSNIASFINIKYVIAHVLLTYFVLQYIIKNPKDYIKISLSLSGGVLLGLLWYYLKLSTIDTLIISFLVSAAGYSMILKLILKRIGIKYNNNKGIV